MDEYDDYDDEIEREHRDEMTSQYHDVMYIPEDEPLDIPKDEPLDIRYQLEQYVLDAIKYYDRTKLDKFFAELSEDNLLMVASDIDDNTQLRFDLTRLYNSPTEFLPYEILYKNTEGGSIGDLWHWWVDKDGLAFIYKHALGMPAEYLSYLANGVLLTFKNMITAKDIHTLCQYIPYMSNDIKYNIGCELVSSSNTDVIEFGADLLEMSGYKYISGMKCLDKGNRIAAISDSSARRKRQQMQERFQFNRDEYLRRISENVPVTSVGNIIGEYMDEPTMDLDNAAICRTIPSTVREEMMWRRRIRTPQ